MSEFDCDVLISGGGMVGGTLAVALGAAGYRVVVVETHPFSTDTQANYDDRVAALSWGSRVLLDQLGLWRDVAADAAAIEHIHVSERGRFGVTRLHAEEEGVAALGYVLENRCLGRALVPRLAALETVEVLAPARVDRFEQDEARISATVIVEGEERSIRARLLVAAEGTQSPLREQAGVEVQRMPYGQTAVIANLSAELDHAGWAYERFTDSGPLAMLPMNTTEDGEPRCSLVWTLRDEDVESVMALDDAGFLAALQARFGQRLGRLHKVGRRSAFPLGLIEAVPQFSGRLLLLGNAARTLHPVAGQGFNLGLRDLSGLVELLTADGKLDDCGSAELLAAFAEARRSDQREVVRMTDSFVKLFSSRFAPLAHLRGAGLVTCDLVPPLRHLLARQSMGMRTRLPVLPRAASQA